MRVIVMFDLPVLSNAAAARIHEISEIFAEEWVCHATGVNL